MEKAVLFPVDVLVVERQLGGQCRIDGLGRHERDGTPLQQPEIIPEMPVMTAGEAHIGRNHIGDGMPHQTEATGAQFRKPVSGEIAMDVADQ